MAENQQSCSHQCRGWVKGKVIGSGSFGTVHLAMNKATGALFVVKSAESKAGFQALRNEAEILESLISPYIVRCIGRDFAEGRNGEQVLNIFMEYMAGGSLSDVAEKFGGTLDAEVIRLYTREVLHGLKYLHDNGIVHGDLKCKNVLLGSNGDVKLADFGCARRINDSKNNGNLKNPYQFIGGTPLWMAPEVLRNEELDSASDIWSLGCTVIEMATGRPPWGDKISNPFAAVLRIACSNEKPPLPKHFCKEGLDFLAKCLERNPKKRWSVDELLDHPFVSDNAMKKSTEECACSPASVLDFCVCRSKYDSEESDSSDEDDEFQCINPFSNRHCGVVRKIELETDFWSSSSGGWITVRSS